MIEPPPRRAFVADLPWVVVATVCTTALGFLVAPHCTHTDLVMLHLLGVLVVASRVARRAASLHAALSVAAFNFFFVEPRYTFHVDDAHFLVTFGGMLVVGLAVSHLTARVREETWRAADARLVAERERTRSTLLSGVSHDLRTPLSCIAGSAEVLLDDPRTHPDARPMLDSIRSESERLARFVNNLLDLTRVGASGFTPAREWCPVEEIVASALERVRGRTGAVDPDVVLPGEVVQAFVDPVLLEHLIVNLLENAARHAPSPDPVTVSFEGKDGVIRIEVRDRGPGPGPDPARPFGLAPGAAAARSGGTGLGLAVCREVARVHGGSLDILPREGGGTVVRVTVPSGTPSTAATAP